MRTGSVRYLWQSGHVSSRAERRGTTERVLALLGLLQRQRVWTGPELADRLGVTPRTVRRDVERLRALGYPVHANRGVEGGYQLGSGRDLPPLLLDDEEAIATALSLLTGAGDAVAGAGDAALRALIKLDRVLPARLRRQVRVLSGSVESFGGGRMPVDPQVLLTLARACRDEVEVSSTTRTGSGRDRGGSSPTAWSPPTGVGISSPMTSIVMTGVRSGSTG